MRWRLLAGRAVGLLLLGHGTTINFEAPALRGSNRGPVGPGPREGPWDRNLTQESNAHHISAFRVGDAVADRGYYEGEEIKSCEEAGITVTLPKPQTSSAKAEGRFGKQDFVYVAAEDVYRCPAEERLTYRFAGVEDGKTIRRYWTSACKSCALKAR